QEPGDVLRQAPHLSLGVLQLLVGGVQCGRQEVDLLLQGEWRGGVLRLVLVLLGVLVLRHRRAPSPGWWRPPAPGWSSPARRGRARRGRGRRGGSTPAPNRAGSTPGQPCRG